MNSTNQDFFIQKNNKKYAGLKFNFLTIIKFTYYRDGALMCINKCDCGKIRESLFQPIKIGTCKSCGCFNVTYHTKHGLRKHPLYHVWDCMKSRCYNKKKDNYKNYGGSGVSICTEWLSSFKCFHDWCIVNGWEPGLQIDRYPNKKGNYEPNNCRIATVVQNMNNKTNNRIMDIAGESMTMAEAVAKFKIKPTTLMNRLNKGMSDYDATHKPVRSKKKNNYKLLLLPK